MEEIILDALADAAKILPFLLAIYVGIELVEYKFGNKIRERVQRAGMSGPAIGAVAGIFPQCGFSVVTTALYTQRLVTVGTLLAVYLATSDEAIPIILSWPGRADLVVTLILTKLAVALIAGYAVDLSFAKARQKTLAHIEAYEKGNDDARHHHETVLEEPACCGHSVGTAAKKFRAKELILHPVVHTAKIFLFVFLATLAINYAVAAIGQGPLEEFFSAHRAWQPFIAALVGLLPDCAASVAITEMYLKGIITYGAAIAGLCAGAGLGMLVLFREEKNKKNVALILCLLFGISVFAGSIIQYCF